MSALRETLSENVSNARKLRNLRKRSDSLAIAISAQGYGNAADTVRGMANVFHTDSLDYAAQAIINAADVMREEQTAETNREMVNAVNAIFC